MTRGNQFAAVQLSCCHSGLKLADSPSFERYTKDFNPETGVGGMEIWIPIEE